MRLYRAIDLAYIAGFIDGEGTVSLKRNGTRWPTVLPYILITNTNIEVEGNVVWTTKYINIAKRNMSPEKFIEMCIKVADHVQTINLVSV